MKNKNDNEQQPITGERQPTELRGLRPITIGSFCSGYGGLEIGVSRAFGGNTRTVFMVERETFAVANMANKIQEKRMDSALIYNDVRTFPYRKYRGCIDVAVAGIPCQPHSSAGKRQGGGDERFLFDDWLDGISEMRPSYVLIENVEGLCSSKMPDGTLCLGYVFRRLEDVGYQVERADKTLSFGTFSAAEIVGADGRRIPHLRKRVFILAKLADGVSTGLEGHAGDVDETTGQTGRGTHRPISESGLSRTVYPSRPGERQCEWEEPRVVGGELADTKSGESGKSQAGNRRKDTGGGSEEEYVGNASSERSHRGSEDGTDVEPEVSGTRHESYVANAECIDGRRERREEQAGQPSGEPIKDSNQSDGRSEAQSELGGTTDGTARGVDAITNRVDRLRLLGNGVVPDCAELAFRTLFNQLHNEQ
jgi:DNA (cytosine-5)-methyltransferase 1